MIIKESRNLIYSRHPVGEVEAEEEETIGLCNCMLVEYKVSDDKVDLYFKNRTEANIQSKNPEGSMEMVKIREKLPEFIGKSYEDILERLVY